VGGICDDSRRARGNELRGLAEFTFLGITTYDMIIIPPPGLFATEARYVLEPVPFAVKAFAPGSLFAGKVHALHRAKGRDWYDFVFFVSRGVPLDVRHLEARLCKSGHWTGGTLDVAGVQGMIGDAIENVDLEAAKEEVRRFLVDPRAIDVWSKEFFRDVAERLRIA